MWTSNNIEIDKFLQKIQIHANNSNKIMEWIPYHKLIIKDHIGNGGFGIVKSASWIDGPIISWDNLNQEWKRNASYDSYPVALKFLKDSNKLTSNLLKEVSYNCYNYN